jgi:hypothetical protein
MPVPKRGTYDAPIELYDDDNFSLALMPDGSLRMTVRADGLELIEDNRKGQGWRGDNISGEAEFMEAFRCNTPWLFCYADEFGALSQSPVLVHPDSYEYNEDTSDFINYKLVEPVAYWHDSDYQIRSFMDDLVEHGYHDWDRNPYADE